MQTGSVRAGLAAAGLVAVVTVGLAAGCGGKAATPASPDAAPVAGGAGPALVPVPVATPAPGPARPARPRLHLTLRSTPPGAAVSVDGRPAGAAPMRLEVDDDARPHEFTFTAAGYLPWRLRFSPSQDGVVHAALQAVPVPVPDAGMGDGP